MKFTTTILPHFLFIGTLLFIIFYPLYRKNLLTPPGSYYMQIHRLHEDYYYDLSVINQGRKQVSEIDQFTTEEARPSTIHLFYLLMGRIGSLIGVNNFVIYYSGMVTSLVIFYVYAYKLVELLIPKGYVWLTMFVAFFASPFPAIKLTLGSLIIPLQAGWWTGMDAYSRISMLPHHFIATSLTLAAIYYLFLYRKKKTIISAFISSVLLAVGVIFFAVPGIIFLMSLVTMLGVIGAIRGSREIKGFLKGLIFYVIPLISLLTVNFQLTRLGFPWTQFLNWEYTTYLAETTPYTLLVFFISLGLMPFFVLFVLGQLVRKPKTEMIFLFSWVTIPFILYLLSANGILKIPKIRWVYYSPYLFMTVLGMMGLVRTRGIIVIKVIMVIIFIINAVWGFHDYWWGEANKIEVFSNTYIPRNHLKAVDFINLNIPPYSNILTTYYTGAYLPALTYAKVFVGHEVNTYNFGLKFWQSKQFFSGLFSESEARALITGGKINYVLWEDSGLPVQYSGFLKEIYNDEGIRIYKVVF